MSALHELEAELFRNQPELARELLRLCAGIDVGAGSAEIGSGALTEVAPAEYLADAVTVIRDAERVPVAAIVVEVQRSRDARKKYSWPVYVTGLRAKLKCPVTLLVLAPDRLASWAGRAIDIGHPGFGLRPVVIRTSDVPRVTDPGAVTPELLVLSALAHPDASMIAPLAAVLDPRADETRRVYLTLISANWPIALRRQLEAAMRPELEAAIKKVMYQVGVRDGRDEGREQGQVVALQKAVIAIARQRGALTAEAETRVMATTDAERLMKLITDVGAALDVAAARDALAAL